MNDRIRKAVEEAAKTVEALKARQAVLSQCGEPARIGDVYVTPNDSDIAVSWLVVNICPTDSSLVLVVPVDDFPLVGVCDVRAEEGPEVARCGLSYWAVRSELKPAERVDYGHELWAQQCRRVLHLMATGQEVPHTDERERTECDPEYEEHCREVMAIGESEW